MKSSRFLFLCSILFIAICISVTVNVAYGSDCGDYYCSYDENYYSCPTDCQGSCGNGNCENGEWDICPGDCSLCGDQNCDVGENEWSCPDDCSYGWCGDWNCQYDENPESCPDDCSYSSCYNGRCSEEENALFCPQDCTYRNCGDGYCTYYENPDNCPADCSSDACYDDICTDTENASVCMTGGCDVWEYCSDGYCDMFEVGICPEDCAECGDGMCEWTENPWDCPQDCSDCGDGYCTHEEDPSNCSYDCYAEDCGDGSCSDNENQTSCPADCGVCGDGTCDTDENEYFCPSDCGTGPVRISGTPPVYYQTFQDAYNSASPGDIIQVQAIPFVESPYIGHEKAVTIQGGYNTDFTEITVVNTIVSGNMTIDYGSVTIENLTLQ